MILTTAFQPIVDITTQTVFAYEALARGPNNETAHDIIQTLTPAALLEFDHKARKAALSYAAKLNISCALTLNFLPSVLMVSDSYFTQFLNEKLFDPKKIIIEVTESEPILSAHAFSYFLTKYREMGVKIAIDDFGAGFSGLNALVDYLPDLLKLDIKLIKNIHQHGAQQAIVNGVIQVCDDLGIEIIAEGVETAQEYEWLKSRGIALFQGFYFARPGFESLPSVTYPQ